MERKNTKKNAFTLRITDSKTLAIFDDLLATKAFESKNVLANKILAYGIQSFSQRYLGSSAVTTTKTKAVDSDRDLKQIRATTEDTHVMLMVLERLVASIYNIMAAEIAGEKVASDELNSGLLAELPDDFQAMKDEIIRMRAKRAGVDHE